jgi:hypothetical protein
MFANNRVFTFVDIILLTNFPKNSLKNVSTREVYHPLNNKSYIVNHLTALLPFEDFLFYFMNRFENEHLDCLRHAHIHVAHLRI